MGMFDSLFGQKSNKKAYQKAEDAYGQSQGVINRLLDPAALQNEWAQGYETSPYAKQLMGQAQTSGLDAASAMGLGGSSAALGNIQNSATNLMNADRQQYLNDLMGKYQLGSQQAMEMGNNMAGLEFGKYQQPQNNMFGQLMGAGLQFGADYLTGGMATPAMAAMKGMGGGGGFAAGPEGYQGGGYKMPTFQSMWTGG